MVYIQQHSGLESNIDLLNEFTVFEKLIQEFFLIWLFDIYKFLFS